MKCFLSNFLRYCLLIYTIVATGGTIRTRTTMTSTTNTKTKTTIMTIETSPMDSNNCQAKANVECCYYQEEALQKQQQQQLSGKKDIKLTKREIDERLQQPFKIMQSIEEEMEPEEEEEEEKEKYKDDQVEEEANQNDHDDDDDDDDDDEENSLDYEDDENDDDDDEEENIKANKNRIRRRRRKRRKKRKRKNGNKNPKRKRKRRKHQHATVSPLGQPANLLLASLTQLPTAHPQPHRIIKHKRKRTGIRTTTTMKPKLKPLKYILNKGNLIKKKKQEYLSHLGYVFLPFIKFVAFFTVLNPFTLAVFFFMLISPVVFGLLGFTALSFILRPAMNLLFAVKHRIGNINRNHRRYRHKQQHKHNHIAPRPITIHKHYYPQQPRPNVHPPLFLRRPTRPLLYQPHRLPHPHRADYDKDISFHNSTEDAEVVVNGLVNVQQPHQNFNPLLPQVRQQLKHIQPPVGLSTRFILPSL